ncbi:MAG: polyhydroxyalkanoate depolymerase [Alphaproteobacteria bacterium]|nr:polyhydroxyalkanoate depolymerase [Alphaproteobacteria bacterium]
MFQYHLLDLQNIALAPWSQAARVAGFWLKSPLNPLSYSEAGCSLIAVTALFEQATRPIIKPAFNITQTHFRGDPIKVKETTCWSTPFCQLLNFSRSADNLSTQEHLAQDPRVLIVTPMAGHFATLMRGTVESLLSSHDIYITDWSDAKMVPLSNGYFDLEDQIETIINIIKHLGPNLHIIGISQASLSALCAVSILAAQNQEPTPSTLTLLGGPIDARDKAAVFSEIAQTNSLSWFRKTHIQIVPSYYPGALRMVYPGPQQLLDRMALSLDRHVTEHIKYYQHLVRGDEDAAANHEKFYDEFLSVMDVTEEFYIQLVERAYQRCDLPNHSFSWRGQKVDPTAIQKTALLTVEGEMDDLSPPGQTRAALDLCTGIPPNKKKAHLEIAVGHYGIFNGRRWRNNIEPMIHKFIRENSAP